MARVLVTGMSGTGKSTVLIELALRGHRTVDLDDGDWSYEAPALDGPGLEQLWREDEVAALLSDGAPIVIGGCASNQGRFYPLLDTVLLLTVPPDVLLHRISSRSSKDFGKDPDERARILADFEAVEPRLRLSATAEIDATRALQDVVDDVQTYLR